MSVKVPTRMTTASPDYPFAIYVVPAGSTKLRVDFGDRSTGEVNFPTNALDVIGISYQPIVIPVDGHGSSVTVIMLDSGGKSIGQSVTEPRGSVFIDRPTTFETIPTP
jgi:hypothetical protein